MKKALYILIYLGLAVMFIFDVILIVAFIKLVA
jgi:hypothetical protein